MENSCQKLVDYIKSLPKGTDVDAKSLSAKYTTQNVVKCGFSMDARCFEDGKSEFREIGKKMFSPSFLNALKFLLYPVIPTWLIKKLPIRYTNIVSVHFTKNKKYFYNNVYFIYMQSLMPYEVDSWFKRIVKENKESRKATGVHSNDIMQTLLEIQEKQSKFNL